MNYGPALTTVDHWMDLPTAADYAGVTYCILVDAVTNRQVRATTTHPKRPGDWMVPMIDVDTWTRQSRQSVNGRGRALPSGLASRV